MSIKKKGLRKGLFRKKKNFYPRVFKILRPLPHQHGFIGRTYRVSLTPCLIGFHKVEIRARIRRTHVQTNKLMRIGRLKITEAAFTYLT